MRFHIPFIRHGAQTALIAALLFIPFVALRIRDTTPLTLGYHWGMAWALIVAVVAGRMVIGKFLQPPKPVILREGGGSIEQADSSKQYYVRKLSALRNSTFGKILSDGSSACAEDDKKRKKHLTKIIGFALLTLLAIFFPLLPFIDRGAIDLVTLVLIYALLAAGLNIVVGLTGLLDLGFIAYFAIGAYAYGILSTTFGIGFWACLPLAAALCAVASLILGLAVLRLRGDYFAIVTLGFGQIVYTLLVNWQGLTHGSQGITGIPRPSLFGLAVFSGDGPGSVAHLLHAGYSPLQRIVFLYYLIVVLVAAANAVIVRLRRLPLGRAWEAVREDEIAAASLGLNRTRIKLSAYAISAAIAGIAGAFFAARQGFISPESFTFMDSAIVLAIVVLGAQMISGQWGILLAAFFLIGLPEEIRALADYRMLAFGAAMVLVMQFRPRGLVGKRQPAVRLT